MNTNGPDISFYQDDPETLRKIDFAKMGTQASFVIIRAGQNLWEDSDFDFNWRESRAVGLPRGSYWFYDSRIEPKLQSRKYIGCFADIQDLGELPLFADFEDKYGGPYGTWQDWYTFLEELKRLVPGKEIGNYTGYYYWTERTTMKNIPAASLEYFHQYPLWIAHYGVDVPMVPKPWKSDEWIFWQYTDKGDGLLHGVESLNIDMNYFNGDEAAFRSRFNLDDRPDPPPIPEGEKSMLKGTVTAGALNIRSTMGVGLPSLGLLQNGDKIEASGRFNGWWKLTKNTRNGINVPLPAPECYAYEGATNGYIWLDEEIVDPPPPLPDAVVDVAVKVAGAAVGVVTVNDAEYVKK